MTETKTTLLGPDGQPLAKSQTSGVANPEAWLVDALGGGTTSNSGSRVTYYSSLTVPAVWASVQLLSSHFGMCPLTVRKRTPTGSEPIPNHPSERVHDDPNDNYQTGVVFKETLLQHALISGNGRAVIVRNGVGQPTELILMWPESSYTQMIGGEKWHMTTFDPLYVPPGSLPVENPPDGSNEAPGAGAWYRFHDKDVLHLPGLSYNGLYGLTVYQVLKDTIGLDKAGQDNAGYAFRNNGRPGLVIEVPEHQLRTQKEVGEFMSQWSQYHEGSENRGKTALIRDGMKLNILPTSAVDSQFVEQRKAASLAVAAIFGTQNMIGESAAVYKDLSQRMAAYITNTFAKWTTKYEAECNRKLLSDRERMTRGAFHKMDMSVLIKTDKNALADYSGKLVQQKAVTVNEVREMHGLNKIEGADDLPEDKPEPQAEPAPADTAPRVEQDDQPNARRLHFQKMIKAESDRIARAAKKDDFMAWSEKHFRDQRGKYGRLCEQLGVPVYRADDFISKSIDQILELGQIVPAEDLTEAVANAVSHWEDRANEFDT